MNSRGVHRCLLFAHKVCSNAHAFAVQSLLLLYITFLYVIAIIMLIATRQPQICQRVFALNESAYFFVVSSRFLIIFSKHSRRRTH